MRARRIGRDERAELGRAMAVAHDRESAAIARHPGARAGAREDDLQQRAPADGAAGEAWRSVEIGRVGFARAIRLPELRSLPSRPGAATRRPPVPSQRSNSKPARKPRCR